MTRYLGRYRTLDGAHPGKRPKIETFQDLLWYRQQQLAELEAGRITEHLFRTRIRRWCKRYREIAENRILLRDRVQANPTTNPKETTV